MRIMVHAITNTPRLKTPETINFLARGSCSLRISLMGMRIFMILMMIIIVDMAGLVVSGLYLA